MPPVFGRDKEIQQVLEILCHRERANSVMLDRRAGRRQDGDRRGAGAAHRVRARERAGAAARLPGRQPADEHDGRRHDAARHVRGSHPERHPRAEGAAQPHSVRRRGAHDGRRRLGARRAVGRGEHVQVGARARRDPHGRGDDARANTRNTSRKTRRWRAASAASTCCEPTIEETRRILYNLRPRLERNYSVRLLDEAIETALDLSPRYMRHLHLPDKVIGWLDTAAVRAEIDRRWEVKTDDVVVGDLARGADSRGHGLPRRHRSLQGHRERAADSASSARRRRCAPWRGGWC